MIYSVQYVKNRRIIPHGASQKHKNINIKTKDTRLNINDDISKIS
jgi:hypothetical protein